VSAYRYWKPADGGRVVRGRVEDYDAHSGFRFVYVRWEDGSVGRFIEGQEPPELHVAPALS
jgi:hypothetical protein